MQAPTESGGPGLSDRLPPQNLEAERHVLSACLLDAQALDDVLLMISPEDFYREAHGLAYGALKALRDEGRTTDAVALADELIRRGEYKRLGGNEFLAEIANAAPHAANARYHADIVRQKSVTRRLIQSAMDTIRDGYSNLFTAQQLVESAEAKIFAIRDGECSDAAIEAEDLIAAAMTTITGRHEGSGRGLMTGFADLDGLLDGFKDEELSILAARPSMGKTALALQIIEHVSIEQGRPCLFVSLEMGSGALGDRMLATHAMVDGFKIRRPWTMTMAEMNRLGNSAARLSAAKITIADSPSRTVGQIAAMGRRMKHRGGLGLVVIDYLQLIDDERAKGEARHEGIAKISRRLKATARELKVPVIALSQLNRASEQREDRRPRLADLRESGQIEQDADSVLLLHRPEFYDPNDQPGIAEVIVAKNRNGPTGNTRLAFLKSCTRFDSLTTAEQAINAQGF